MAEATAGRTKEKQEEARLWCWLGVCSKCNSLRSYFVILIARNDIVCEITKEMLRNVIDLTLALAFFLRSTLFSSPSQAAQVVDCVCLRERESDMRDRRQERVEGQTRGVGSKETKESNRGGTNN